MLRPQRRKPGVSYGSALALLAALVLVAASAWPVSARAELRTVPVVVPDGDNLQLLAFWLAEAAGLFEQEGLRLDLRIPDRPARTADLVISGEADIYILPAPVLLHLIGEDRPVVLVANLLTNDPINLIARPEVAAERGLSADMPLAQRLTRMQGLRIGVAPGPPRRLRALFRTAGLDADSHVTITHLPGPQQNRAFGERSVDLLYAHTPYLEEALVEQGAVLVVNQSSGEVAAVAQRHIHGLVVSRSLRDQEPALVQALVRAIATSQELIHRDRARAAELLGQRFPAKPRAHMDTIVKLYEPAVPARPDVTVAGLRAALELFPVTRLAPTLTDARMQEHVDNRFAATVQTAGRNSGKGSSWLPWVALAAAGTVIGAAGLVLVMRRRR